MESAENDMKETLITLTSDIVAAHVSNNSVDPDELAKLIGNVYNALAGLGHAPAEPAVTPAKPAVSVRASLKPDRITCLDCGMELKMLKRHLTTHHAMSPEDYRARWNLAPDYPLVAPDYAMVRRNLAVKIGLGRKPGARRGKGRK